MQALKKLSATAIIADSWKSLLALPPVNIPVLMLAHGMDFPSHVHEKKRARIQRNVNKATIIIANSTYTVGLVQPYLQGWNGTLEIIHPPIDPQPDAPQMPAIMQPHTPRILTLARLEPRKGVDQIIRAMPAVLAQHPLALYIVAGGGEDRARLEALAQELNIRQAVHFTGPVDAQTKAALYQHADLFAMPTRREGNSVEGFGLTFIEAAWYGVPSIAGADGGAPDAVLHEQTGIVCDGADAKAVEAALLDLLNDPAKRKILGEAAAVRARGPLQWRASVGRYLALMNLDRAAD